MLKKQLAMNTAQDFSTLIQLGASDFLFNLLHYPYFRRLHDQDGHCKHRRLPITFTHTALQLLITNLLVPAILT